MTITGIEIIRYWIRDRYPAIDVYTLRAEEDGQIGPQLKLIPKDIKFDPFIWYTVFNLQGEGDQMKIIYSHPLARRSRGCFARKEVSITDPHMFAKLKRHIDKMMKWDPHH
jgi:hypothetical protein